MSRSMNLDVLVRLRDRMSRPLNRLKQNLRSLVNFGRQIGVIGTAIAAISFIAPIKEAAAFQQKMLDIASTQNLVGDAAFDFAKVGQIQYQKLALEIGIASDTIADGAKQMIAAGGRSAKVFDSVIGDIGLAAKAATADLSDMAGVSTALLNTLDVPEAGLKDALAGLVVAGKEGAFELKEMGKYYPQLTGQMRKFGIVGREASDQLATMLQVARMGTSDPGQAANNLNNFLSKALAPITKKNFKDMGVDIEAVMTNAAIKGINPIEAMIQKIGVLTGVSAESVGGFMDLAKKRGMEGGEALEFVRQQIEAIGGAGKLGELFGDQQVLDFLLPMLANVEEYKRIKSLVAEATGAVIDNDATTQMASLNTQLTILSEIGTQAARKVGLAFGTWLPDVNAALMGMLGWVNDLDEATDGWVTTALTAAGGGLLLVGAIGALGLALPVALAGFSALASLAAVVVGPIGLLIGAIALGAVHVSKNWDRYGPRLMRMWDRTRRGFTEFAGDLVDRGRDIVRRGRELVDRYGPAVREGVGRAWQEVSRIARSVAARLPSFDTIKIAGLEALAGVLERLKAIGSTSLDVIGTSFRGFIDGLTANFDLTGFSDGFDTLLSALGRVPTIIGNIRDIFAGSEEKVEPDVFGSAWKRAGELIGQGATLIGDGFKGAADAINAVLTAIEEITGAVANGEPIAWENILPKGVADAYQGVVDWIDKVKAKLEGFEKWLLDFKLPGIAAPGLPSVGAFGSTEAGRGSQFGSDPLRAIKPGEVPANSNSPAPDQRSSLASPTSLASAEPSATASALKRIRVDTNQQVDVRVKVDGPGKVTSVKNSSAPDRGRASIGNAA